VAVVLLPSLLATEAGGRGSFELDVDTVGDALRALPVAPLLFDEGGELRRLVNVYVDGEDVRTSGGLDAPVREGATVVLLPAMAGGMLLDR